MIVYDIHMCMRTYMYDQAIHLLAQTKGAGRTFWFGFRSRVS